jgi:hypothetical protein
MATASQSCVLRFWKEPDAAKEQGADRFEQLGGPVSESPRTADRTTATPR